jgi:hypothetical protein
LLSPVKLTESKNGIKNAIISANNHNAGFGPMTAKLFSEMMNLKDYIRPFPISDYKISSNEITQLENERNYRIYKLSY